MEPTPLFETSESIAAIAKALQEFHKEMGVIYKEDQNPFFKSKYATLATVLTGIKEPLQKANLSFAQFPVGKNQMVTILMHGESGEWMCGTFEMTPSKNDPQGQGSVITYQRRYALGAVLGLNIDADGDGNAASEPTKKVVKKASKVPEDIPETIIYPDGIADED